MFSDMYLAWSARHPLWAAWEHTLELSLAQLPSLVTERPQPYVPSTFFRDQLTAFQLWLELGECESTFL
ncbi:unnamed protein product [Leptidea sinapis]|uniref:Uncharacterized protein n=1 Tax=Leptidea sinapis TaxID=189913 RepID=A0A5E4QB56_9NEOP|nr:unnamed protein product [Leptidea sinapis]